MREGGRRPKWIDYSIADSQWKISVLNIMSAVQFSSCSWGKSEASVSGACVFIHDIALPRCTLTCRIFL
jgi:hypothetical protein